LGAGEWHAQNKSAFSVIRKGTYQVGKVAGNVEYQRNIPAIANVYTTGNAGELNVIGGLLSVANGLRNDLHGDRRGGLVSRFYTNLVLA